MGFEIVDEFRQPNKSQKKICKSRSKVKTACKTCKIRKVKCDEGKPACQRCVSTGRVCDGYGIWGGGGNSYNERSIGCKERISPPNTILATPMITPRASTHEQDCFEWFTCQTVKKFPGLFGSPFWEILVCQASSSEPAVLHAVLAFSSAHKKEGLDSIRPGKSLTLPDTLEQFTLQQYSHAITHLQPHFATKTKDSVRVALVTCLIFIHMEFLRGHYRTGNFHLQNGLKLLAELQGQPNKGNGVVDLKPPLNFVDSCLTDTFIRLQSQAILLGQNSGDLYLVPHMDAESSDTMFYSITAARRSLERVLNEIYYLTEQSSREQHSQTGLTSEELVESQRHIQPELLCWFSKYQVTQAKFYDQTSLREKFAYRVLHLYHTMATIMANTCISSTSQSTFDPQLHHFISIITQYIEVWKIVMSNPITIILPAHGLSTEISDSVAEMGGVLPLYYTALKCRNHRVRLQAIKLMRSIPHKEGMWDVKIAATIATQVMEIEEGDFYKNIEIDDNFALSSLPMEQDLVLPVLPELYRLHEVQVVLPDSDSEKVALICRRKLKNGEWEIITRECEVLPLARVKKPGRPI
ncbi:uncharacterized protein LY89DRAFT_658031 [Mollisia scopiformis]|uniref:Zn(2)-C6 fungal-type domain-containing protein n=1 Tax=Mollisia scopiformis TaxID=149040 RepID=A0A132B9A1_MOLSC|nr:uncharacterized protein LY89DRAFT_658031 [Mollisia scopiformis]KUJ08975.1 hypothetical protein LY89DRAFT_658031 [Mollisia scopiformis]